ncbi:sporulation protein YtxC [Tumebacillus lipolyticus]|uniref:Sporulation protein YtxC n=1 Tax=Tumebacillus lipolyticus TaxID=1280370 RepID=A0ABW4ZVT1_9BACL
MKKLTVGVEKHPGELCARLEGAREELERKSGIRLSGEQHRCGKYTFFTYRIIGTSEGRADNFTRRAIEALAEGIADYITDVWERHELQRIVASDFYYYGEDEIEYLSASAVEMLAGLLDEDGNPLRASHIAQSAAEVWHEGGELLIDGLLRFRLQAFHEDLHRVALQAIDEYLMDLEYQEFVKLMRYFLNAQEPQLPLLHMICTDERTVKLFNAEGKLVELDQSGDSSAPGSDIALSAEDRLMSTLISLAPEKLYIHLGESSDAVSSLVETVEHLFADRSVVCRGCLLCQSVQRWEELLNKQAKDS